MRTMILVASWLLVCVCEAAGFPGSYVLEHAYGRIDVNLDQKGGRLIGTVNFMGKAKLPLAGNVMGNRANGTLLAKDGAGVFEAVVQGDVLTLTIAQSAELEQPLTGMPLQFSRVHAGPAGAAARQEPNAPTGDPRLVGSWVYQDLLASGNVSQASEEHMLFEPNGSYAYARTDPGAGTRSRSFAARSRDQTTRTRWRADAGVLYLLENEAWVTLGRYAISDDGQAMRITYRAGNRKLWSRR